MTHGETEENALIYTCVCVCVSLFPLVHLGVHSYTSPFTCVCMYVCMKTFGTCLCTLDYVQNEYLSALKMHVLVSPSILICE